MMDPIFHHIYLLLGVERQSWSWQMGSFRISDFGGRPNAFDSCVEETAAREFYEETCGCVAFTESQLRGPFPLPRSTTIKCITTMLQDKQYWIMTRNKHFVTYWVLIPWDPNAAQRFSHCRTLLGGLNNQIRNKYLTQTQLNILYPTDLGIRRRRHIWIVHHPAVIRSFSKTREQPSGKTQISGIKQQYLEKDHIWYYSMNTLRNLCSQKHHFYSIKHSFRNLLLQTIL